VFKITSLTIPPPSAVKKEEINIPKRKGSDSDNVSYKKQIH